MSRPARLCSISTAPSRESRTAAARRWKVPCTTNSFSVVRTTRVRSHIQTARSTIRAPRVWSRTPAIEAGQPIAMQPRPTTARPSARTNGPASTIACRRSSRQTRSQPEVIIAFTAFAGRRKIPGHEAKSTASSPLDPDRHSDRRGGARALEGEARSRPRLPRVHPRRGAPPGNRAARAGRHPPWIRPPHPLRPSDRRGRIRPLDGCSPRNRSGAERAGRHDESADPPGSHELHGDQARHSQRNRQTPPQGAEGKRAASSRRRGDAEGLRGPPRDLLPPGGRRLLDLRAGTRRRLRRLALTTAEAQEAERYVGPDRPQARRLRAGTGAPDRARRHGADARVLGRRGAVLHPDRGLCRRRGDRSGHRADLGGRSGRGRHRATRPRRGGRPVAAARPGLRDRGRGVLFGGFAVVLAVPLVAVLVTVLAVVVRDVDPAEEDVPTVLFPAKDAET